MLAPRLESFVPISSLVSPRRRSAGQLAFAALCGLVVAWGADPVAAQGKLEAQYEASLAGIPVGRGASTPAAPPRSTGSPASAGDDTEGWAWCGA